MRISVFIIATNKYNVFVQPLINSIKNYFLIDHKIEVELFTDILNNHEGDERVTITQNLIPAYRFPDATTLRYKIITNKQYDTDYCFYFDADMKIVDYVGDEILKDLICVRHPGFYHGNGSWETNPLSTAYTERKEVYYAGGFQGGSVKRYYEVMQLLAANIDEDRNNGIEAIWNDESHWNCYLSDCENKTILNPDYCMPEALWKRKAWSINNFIPKILALEKTSNFRK